MRETQDIVFHKKYSLQDIDSKSNIGYNTGNVALQAQKHIACFSIFQRRK